MSAKRPADAAMPADRAALSGTAAVTGAPRSKPAEPEGSSGVAPGTAPNPLANAQGGFLTRWSRRKSQALAPPVRAGIEPPDLAEPQVKSPGNPQAPAERTRSAASEPNTELNTDPNSETNTETNTDSNEAGVPATSTVASAPPTLEDVSRLTPQSDFGRFVRPDVDPAVKNAALKTLFSDPHFNLMDGLDTYIDDYGKPDPLPPGMLRQMAQSHFLRLFDEEPGASAKIPAGHADPAPTAQPTEPPPEPTGPLDENADLRLQPDDVARCTSPAPSLVLDPGRES